MAVSWCVPEDIRENVSGSDDGTGTCAVLTDDQLTDAITSGAAKVAAYTGTTWQPDASTPVITVPDLVFTTTVQLATFYATLTYRKGKALGPGDPVLLGYQDAMRTLADFATGKIDMSPPTPGMASDTAGHVVNTVPRTLTMRDSNTVLNPLTRTVEADDGAGTGWARGGW